MARYYTLALGTRPLEHSNGFPWPYEVAISFDKTPDPVAFSEGTGPGAVGTVVNVRTAISGYWNKHFEIGEGMWLIPHLQRLAEGIPLPREDMLREFEQRHGSAPTWFDLAE